MNSGILPSPEIFEKNAKDGKSQLVWTWVPADLETPVSAYLKLTANHCHPERSQGISDPSTPLRPGRDDARHDFSFLLESIEGGSTLGRYSSIGLEPDLTWTYKKASEENPLTTLRKLVRESRIDIVAPEIPPMASSGLFGYMGYDMVRLIEDIPDNNPALVDIPDSVMIRPTIMVIFDNVQSRMCICTPVRDSNDSYDAATRRLEKILDRLADPIPTTALYPLPLSPSSPPSSSTCPLTSSPLSPSSSPLSPSSSPPPSSSSPRRRGSIDPQDQTQESAQDSPWIPAFAGMTSVQAESNLTKPQYFAMVDKAADYIRAGEIFQVVLGQKFSMKFDLPGFSLYRSLRRLNPSPFMFYFNFGGFQIVGSSPEILVRVRNRRVTIRPIAGTRRRGKTSEEDAALADELLADPKECAEHLMLLDLGRNDIGRVAKTGTVKVTERFVIERYSHVMHIVSNVEGELRDDLDSLDALFAGFPAGTVSGAPKVRAMEIIDELEPSRRGLYGGCIGYLDGNGDLDTCIALRTALVKDRQVHVQASAGIVADSVPESEYNECHIKARAIVQAADEALSLASQARKQSP